MKSIVVSRSRLIRSSRGKFAALLLVGVLLLCHGAFGVLHLCTTTQSSPSHAAHEHQSHTGGEGGAHQHHQCHLMHVANYYAVLLTAIFGLVLGLLLLKNGQVGGRLRSPLSVVRHLHPSGLHLPRGPTYPLLQVMRL